MAKKILLVIAFKDFQDQEYGDTRKVLENKDIEIKIASTEKGEAEGKFGQRVKVDKILSEVDVNEYSAVIFIGGVGAIDYFENKEALSIAKKAFEKNKVTAAICCAPMILYKAGILNNNKFTVYPEAEWVEEISKRNNYLDQDVVVDNNIITGSGPNSAREFGKKITEKLQS